MYSSEVIYRGQTFLEQETQKVINRMSRVSLGVMRLAVTAFLMANGGSMPAIPRLWARQEAFAARTVL